MTSFVESTITFPYKRSLGPVVGAFMTALTEKRILGIRNGDAVLVPPMEWDPATGAELAHDFVEVGPAGTVESWTWVPEPSIQHPLDRPFGFAFVKLDGATTPLLHAVDAGSPDAMEIGLRVAPAGEAPAQGHLSDIVCFVPGEEPEVEGDDRAPADEPVTRMDYLASITYRNPVPPTRDPGGRRPASSGCSASGAPCASGSTPAGRGYCPIDAVELGPDHEVDLSQTGTITNFTIITPVQYPGQTETEPFVRAFVLLDGFDVVLGYQPTIELPADDVRVGLRVSAVWASPAEDVEEGGAWAAPSGASWAGCPTASPTSTTPTS